MNATARYFIDLLKSNSDFCDKIVFKNFWTDKFGIKIWTPEDIVNDSETKKTTIIGINKIYPEFINTSFIDVPESRSHSFEYTWKDWGTFTAPINCIEDGPLTKFLESIFTQMLLLADKGMNVFLGDKLLVKKNTSYEHLMKIDMMNGVE